MDDYFSMRQRMIKGGNLSDYMKVINGEKPDEKDDATPAEKYDDTVQKDTPAAKQEDEAPKVTNSYIDSEQDDDIASFERNIGRAVIPDAIVVPPDDEDDIVPKEATPRPAPEQQVTSQSDEPVARQPRPYVPPKSGSTVKIDYGSEENSGIRFSNLKKVPVDLVALAESYFPTAANKQDAIAAYIYIKEGKPTDVNIPDGVREIAESYTGETMTAADVDKSLKGSVQEFRTYVQKQLRALAERLYTVEMLLGYSVFDQLEFRQKSVPTPQDIDLQETGLADLLKHVEKQADSLRKKEEYNKNRPY